MAPEAFQFSRGNVFRVKFHPPDQPSKTIEKYVVNLQEGKIVENSPTFVGLILTTQRLQRIYPTDVLVTEQECGHPGGVKITCNQIHTIPKKDIISFEYKLSDVTMDAVGEKSLLSIAHVEVPARERHDPLSPEIIKEIDTINVLFYGSYGARLINIPAARFIEDLLMPCNTEDQLARKVAAISDFIDWMDFAILLSDEERKQLRQAHKSGSINALEVFLSREAPNYDKSIISNLRNINKLRQQYPIHSLSKGVVEAHKSLGIEYPVLKPRVAWYRIQQVLLEALRAIRVALFT